MGDALKELPQPELLRLIPSDDRIYKIVRNKAGPTSAVGIGVVSGENEWDFECSLVQSASGLFDPCNVVFMCSDPKVD